MFYSFVKSEKDRFLNGGKARFSGSQSQITCHMCDGNGCLAHRGAVAPELRVPWLHQDTAFRIMKSRMCLSLCLRIFFIAALPYSILKVISHG